MKKIFKAFELKREFGNLNPSNMEIRRTHFDFVEAATKSECEAAIQEYGVPQIDYVILEIFKKGLSNAVQTTEN